MIGNFFRGIRKNKGLNLKTVSVILGIHYNTLSRLERNVKYPVNSTIYKNLCMLFGIDFSKIRDDIISAIYIQKVTRLKNKMTQEFI